MQNIKIGDIVETCSLMPGIVMHIDNDDIYVRMLDEDEYDGSSYTDFSNCSLSHCGIVKITSNDAIKRLLIGKEILSDLWNQSNSYEEYIELLNTAFEKKLAK